MSLSAKLRIMSTKEGTEPVVNALTLGMVTVGGVAWPVKGIALPERMRLEHKSACLSQHLVRIVIQRTFA